MLECVFLEYVDELIIQEEKLTNAYDSECLMRCQLTGLQGDRSERTGANQPQGG